LARFLGRIFRPSCHAKRIKAWGEWILSWRHAGFSVHSRVLSVSFLTEAAVVDRIIVHLKLVFVAERPPPPQAAFQPSRPSLTPLKLPFILLLDD